MSTQEKIDQPTVFERLTSILGELHEEIKQQLFIFPKENQPFREFTSSDGKINGSLLTFCGEVIDKLINTKINAIPMGFGTVRLVVWLNSSIDVPHLVFDFGTTPDIFFYMDYIPRVDLWNDLDYLQRYYATAGSTHLKLRENSDLSVFVSKSLYIRQLQSPVHISFTCPNTEDSLGLIHKVAHEMCDRWLTWVKQATPVPDTARSALAKRDFRIRRISAERDPDNAAVAKIFGDDFIQQLVKALWQKEPVNSGGG